MTASDADILAQLDNDLDDGQICECACESHPDRHGPPQCTKPATWYVELHIFGRCQLPAVQADPNVTPDGDRCRMLCTECLASAVAFAQGHLARLPARAQCPPWPAAAGCGRPFTTLDDYIPVRRPL